MLTLVTLTYMKCLFYPYFKPFFNYSKYTLTDALISSFTLFALSTNMKLKQKTDWYITIGL